MIPTNGMVVGWVVCILMLLPLLAIGKDKRQQEAVALLAKARELSDIRCEGCPAFRMKARVRVWDLKGKPIDGIYTLVWASPRQWRDEISLPNFTQARVGGGNKLRQRRSPRFLPVQMFRLMETLDFTRRLRPGLEGQAWKIKKHTTSKCIELRFTLEPRRELCFDSRDGRLLREQVRGPSALTYEYGDYSLWGKRLIPRLLRSLEDDAAFAEARVEELTVPEQLSPESFAAPPGSEEWPSCAEPEPASMLHQPPPRYPEQARWAGITGVVSVYGVIGVDGKAQRMTVVRSAGTELDRAALSAIENWRYRPSMCAGTPIPVETLIEIRFALSR